jgi:ceramide glucosyltransferase
MIPGAPPSELAGLALMLLASGYEATALIAVLIWSGLRRRSAPPREHEEPVTLLKPLCGPEPRLYDQLRSFCVQDYGRYQVVFGVRDAMDPALGVARRLIREFPELDIDIVVNAQQHGSNRKVSNLLNMLPHARHGLLAIVDSDALVGPDYLNAVVAPLDDVRIGLVTCLYRSTACVGVWSRLGSMYVNCWYMPSVLLAWLFGHRGYASGQTLCLRRNTLDKMGGLAPIANHLADDYELGSRVRAAGLSIALSTYVPRTGQHEASFADLIKHEVRWMRTIRLLRPKSFLLLFLSFSFPVACVGLGISLQTRVALSTTWGLFLTATALRLGTSLLPRLTRVTLADLWLLPLRDLLLLWVWLRALITSRVTWRGAEFDVDARGIMRSNI